MSRYSVAEARNNLSSLIEKALNGETVTITRHGAPVVDLRPHRGQGRAMTAADAIRMKSMLATPLNPSPPSSAELVRAIREEREDSLVPDHR